ncbi:MAG: ferrous iron transporter B, partial [Acidobacteriota bacterium]
MSAPQLAPIAPLPGAGPDTPRLALLGNPNTGKTTLFNRLCGLRAKTANFPGTTTDARIGRSRLGERTAEIIDLPGTYGLDLELPEARINRDVLRGEGLYRRPDAVIVVVDATNLARNLTLVGEVLRLGLPTVVALNMTDLAQRRGLTIGPERLAAQLGCPVVEIVARKGRGIDRLRSAAGETLDAADAATAAGDDTRHTPALPDDLVDWADDVLEASVGSREAVGSAADTFTERLDEAFTHPLLGVALFTAIMAGLFWTVFELASVPMDLIDLTFGILGGWLSEALPAGPLRDLLVDGVVGGIAGTVVFLPQICLLFFLISLLEDTGYLARAAFVMDRLLCRFGRPGQAFVPLLFRRSFLRGRSRPMVL